MPSEPSAFETGMDGSLLLLFSCAFEFSPVPLASFILNPGGLTLCVRRCLPPLGTAPGARGEGEIIPGTESEDRCPPPPPLPAPVLFVIFPQGGPKFEERLEEAVVELEGNENGKLLFEEWES